MIMVIMVAKAVVTPAMGLELAVTPLLAPVLVAAVPVDTAGMARRHLNPGKTTIQGAGGVLRDPLKPVVVLGVVGSTTRMTQVSKGLYLEVAAAVLDFMESGILQ